MRDYLACILAAMLACILILAVSAALTIGLTNTTACFEERL